MIRTKALISNLNDVPREWVFEYYLNLEETLLGQDINMKSPFSVDKVASFYVYYSKGHKCYQFKDFSTGKTGDGVELVKELFSLASKAEAAYKVKTDYKKFIDTCKDSPKRKVLSFKERYKVDQFSVRQWNTDDKRYWLQFKIGSSMLNRYNVKPLEFYRLAKNEDGVRKELHIKGNYIYGYFRQDGSLYKIYQPLNQENKFIKVQDYVQGSDQLTMKVPYLIICSSLKDIMAFNLLKFRNAEVVAPDSENSMMPPHMISLLDSKYKKICVMFDNDPAGIVSMEKYQNKYGTSQIHLKMSKDLSDSIKDHSIDKVRSVLTPIIRNALK